MRAFKMVIQDDADDDHGDHHDHDYVDEDDDDYHDGWLLITGWRN